MSRHIVLCVVFAGCGFTGSSSANSAGDGGADAPVDTAGGGSDGSGSGSGSGSQAADCWSHWLDGPLVIDPSSVRELTELVTANVEDRNPWISDSGLHLYFTRSPGMQGGSDVYFASRATLNDPFTMVGQIVNMNTNVAESRVWLTPDELVYALASDRDGSLQIFLGRRNSEAEPFGAPDKNHLGTVDTAGSFQFDPFLSADGKRLYYAQSEPSGKFHIHIATRSSATADFDPAALLSTPLNPSHSVADPALYQDERLLLFSAVAAGAGEHGDVWYATRPTMTGSFGAAVKIPSVNDTSDDFDPVLSSDGCDLYFGSTRDGGKFHVFRARVTR